MARPKKVKEETSVKPLKDLTVPTHKPFLEAEEPIGKPDILTVYNLNPNYYSAWVAEKKISNGRYTHWVVCDRTHPDFKGLRTAIDDSPKETFIRNGDVILCVCRRETVEKELALKAVTRRKGKEKPREILREGIREIKKGLGDRHEVINVIDDEEDEDDDN